MRYLVVDLAATCWASGMSRGHSETLDIGAVKLASSGGRVLDTFESFVRPTAYPELSEFCTEETGITPEMVELAEPFPDALARFLTWAGPEPFRVCSWGASVLSQFQIDARRHKLALPDGVLTHINLKREFSRLFDSKPVGIRGALAALKLPPPGSTLRCVDTAKLVAPVAARILQKLDAEAEAQAKLAAG